MKQEKRIYVVIPATVQVPCDVSYAKSEIRHVLQPAGRQIAQACHVVSMLRMKTMIEAKKTDTGDFSLTDPITTIILQARDSNEMWHIYRLLKKFNPSHFNDVNVEAYGHVSPTTAIAALVEPRKAAGILGYLPLWGS